MLAASQPFSSGFNEVPLDYVSADVSGLEEASPGWSTSYQNARDAEGQEREVGLLPAPGVVAAFETGDDPGSIVARGSHHCDLTRIPQIWMRISIVTGLRVDVAPNPGFFSPLSRLQRQAAHPAMPRSFAPSLEPRHHPQLLHSTIPGIPVRRGICLRQY